MERLKKILNYFDGNSFMTKVSVSALVCSVLALIVNIFTLFSSPRLRDVIILIVTNLAILLALGILTKWMSSHSSARISIVFLGVSPVLIFLMIENCTENLFMIDPIYWLVNVIILYLVQGVTILFFKHIRVALSCLYIFFALLSLVEYYVYKLRGRSFMLQDIFSFKTAASVINNYTYGMEIRVGITMLFTVAILYFIIIIPEVIVGKLSIIRKIGAIIIMIVIANMLMDANIMSKIPFMGFNQWEIEKNYSSHGYIRTLLATAQYMKIDSPDGYSIDKVEQIVEEYVHNSNAEKIVQQPENIILIMNESWADFRYISDFKQSDTIMPYIDSLYNNTIHGYLHVSVFGGGTDDSEYEALTGNTKQFLDTSNSAYQWYTSEREWGLASTLKSQGYRTVALHPYPPEGWNRKIVYSRMQFDDFLSFENWPISEMEIVRHYANDKSCYDKLISIQKNKEEHEKLFLFLVTIQNHGGYNDEDYESTVHLDYDGDYLQTEQYLSLIRETDDAFSYLLNYFEKVDEPTMIIMFGDHLPNIETEFYERLVGCSWNDMDRQNWQKIYTTPFIIWTNYDIEEKAEVEISSNYLYSYVLKTAGLEMTQYNKCQLTFMEEVPVIGTGRIMSGEGVWYDIEEIPEELEKILADYRILQYNNVFGKNQRVDRIFSIQ